MASVAGAIGAAAGIVYLKRSNKAEQQLKQKALDIEKDLIVRREFLVPLPKNQVVSAVEKQLSPNWITNPDSSEFVASLRRNEVDEMRKANPELWKKIRSLIVSGNESKLKATLSEYVLNYYGALNSPTPSEVRVRVLSESRGESRCILECRPVFYQRILTPAFGLNEGDLDLQAQAAKLECQTLLEDLIVKVGGRKDWQSTVNLT